MFKLCVNPTSGLGEGGNGGLVFVVEVGNRMEGSLPASHIGLMRDGFLGWCKLGRDNCRNAVVCFGFVDCGVFHFLIY